MWILLPAFLIGLSVSITYFIMPANELRQFVETISYNEEFGEGTGLCQGMGWLRLTAKVIFTIEVIAVLIAGTRKINESLVSLNIC